MSDHFGKRTIVVTGVEVSLDVKKGLPIADLSRDMARVASEMAWWASVQAAAEGEAEEVDAHYRRWRAIKTEEILAADPKLAEWKLKARIESDPKFIEYKKAVGKAKENVTLARGVFLSFDKKGNQLQSRGAMARGELDKTGMSTPAEPTESAPPSRRKMVADDETTEARVERMRAINKAKKKRGSDGS